MTVAIRYVDGPRLARSLIAAADWVAAGREELNRINVFPVPDGDTGTNFTLTLRSVADALRALGDASPGTTARTAARGAVLGARGNSGMMLAHFLLGVSERLTETDQATAQQMAQAIRQGADQLYGSLDDPREGTILTVARESAQAAERAAADSPDISVFMTRMLAEGEISLARTPDLLAVLKEAGVVDAGGKGFVRMLEGVVRLIEGDPVLPAETFPEGSNADIPAAGIEVAAESDFQYCTELMIRGQHLPSTNEVRAGMRNFGGSIQVVLAGDILKVHVHTDVPESVFTYAARWGTIETTKAEDMRAQHRHLAHPGQRPVAIVADSSADLPDAILDRHQITLVPLQVMFGDQTFRDRVELKLEAFYQRMRVSKAHPTTSQPTPGDFVRVLREAGAEADEVVAVRGKAWIAGMLDVKPILTLDASGAIIPVDRVRERPNVVPRILSLLKKGLTPRPQRVRFGIVHAEAPEAAERVRAALTATFAPRDVFVSLATGVLGAHVGFGAWAVFWQVEDGTPAHPGGA